MNILEVQLISLVFGFIGISIHAFVQCTWLKWSLIGLDILAFLIVGLIISMNVTFSY